MRALPLTAYSLGKVLVDVFYDGIFGGRLVNLRNGYDPDLIVKCFGFLENRFVVS